VTRIYTDDAELYDIAFDWGISDEVDWLLERLVPDCRTVLEPDCGSGRMLEALAERGREVTGIDLSDQMLELARRRLSGRGTVVLADMTDFDLRDVFDGAVCPINDRGEDRLGRRGARCSPQHLAPTLTDRGAGRGACRGGARGDPRDDGVDTRDLGRSDRGLAVQRGRNVRRWA
jgi:SAM-dependent methyltransferase